ncbi:MAG: hypothetical protein AAB416_00105 [Patescibacteria group bacterium]
MSKDFLAKGKKALDITVVTATVVWTMGFGAVLPAVAETATLKDGDLIKSTTAADVYWYSGGKRSPFPNVAVFNSWNLSFKNVVKMSQADLNKISLSGNNVTFRPCTRLVKIQTDPKTYVVGPGGKLQWLATSEVAKAMFGDMWNKQIDDVVDVLFGNYDPTGADVTAAKALPGCFLKEAASGDVYYVNADNTKSKVDATGLSANRVNTKHVWTAAKALVDAVPASTTKATISAADAWLTMFAPKGAAAAAPAAPEAKKDETKKEEAAKPAMGTGLAVALASDTPATTSILVGTGTVGAQAMVDMLKVNLTAGTDGDVAVTKLMLKRIGVASDSDVNNAYLYADGKRLAEMQSVSAGVLTFGVDGGSPLFTVTKGATLGVWLKMDLATGATSGKTIGFSLNAATDVMAGEKVKPTGTFPLTGNLMSVASVADLGRLTVANVSPAGAVSADAQDNYEAWRFSLQATNQDIEVSYLAMTNTGTTTKTDLKNFKIFDGATQVGTTVESMDDSKMVIFDLSAAPMKITAGQTKQMVLKLDIKAGAGRTYQFSFQKSSDVKSKDKNYGVWLFPFSGGTAGVWTVIRSHTATTATTINSGTLTVSRTADSPTGNVALNGTNALLGKFEFKAAGEDVRVSTLTIRATINGAGANVATNTLRNVKLFISDDAKALGSQIGTTTATLQRLTAGTVATTAAGDASDVALNLGNSLTVGAGKTKYVSFVADLTGAAANIPVIVGFAAGNGNAQGTLSLTTSNVPAAATASNTLTVAQGSLTGSLNSSIANMTVVNGAKNQLVGSFLLTAGGAEGVDLTSVTLTDTTGTAVEALGQALSNVKLFNGTTQLGTTYANPGTTLASTLTFSVSPAISIAAGGSAQIDIKADILSNASGNIANSNGAIRVTTATTSTGKSTASAVSLGANSDLQVFTVATGGTLTTSLDSSTPQDQQVVMASTGNTYGAWQFRASVAEDLNLSQLILIENSLDLNGPRNVRNLELFVDGNKVGSNVPSLSLGINGNTNAAGVTNNGANIDLGVDATNSIGQYVVVLAGPNAGRAARITAVAAGAGAVAGALATLTAIGPAMANDAVARAFKVVSGAVFTGMNVKITANNFKNVILKGSVSLSENASVGARSRFLLGTNATAVVSGASTDPIIAQGDSSGAYVTLATQNAAYQANSNLAYRTKLTVKANSATPSGTGKTRRGNDTVVIADFKTDTANETRIRAAGQYFNMDADEGNWTVGGTGGGAFAADAAAAGILGTAATAVRTTEGAASDATGFTVRTVAAGLSSSNYVSFWVRSSAAKAASEMYVFTNDTANIVSPTSQHNLGALAANTWTYVRLDLRTASAGAVNATDTNFGYALATAFDNNATIDLDEVKFYQDFVRLDLQLAGGANAANALTLTMRKANGATAATGYIHNNGAAATSYIVDFVPTPTEGDLVISTSNATEVLSFVADTSALLGAASSLNSSISLGSSAATNAAPGGVSWFDGTTPAAGASNSVYWVDNQPNPFQGGALGYL